MSWSSSRAWRGARRLLGVLLGVLTLTPLYRLLDHPGTGAPGMETVTLAASNLSSSWLGIGVALGLGVVLAILFPRERLATVVGRVGRTATGVPLGAWVAGLALLSTGLAAGISLVLYLGRPTLVDGMTSLLHARFLAGGQTAGALPDPAAAWTVPNGVLTARGWVSQYPPMHPLLLAIGLRAGTPWMVGPLLTGVLTASAALVAHRLLGRDAAAARLGSFFVAGSPFIVFLGGGYLSHVSASAFAALTLLMALKARDGAWGWSVAAGASMGVMVTSRPWVGLLLGTAFTLGLWLYDALQGSLHVRRMLTRLGGATLGGAPFAIAWGIYNHRYFGHALRLGYTAGFGESHGLGFHVDPWGNTYGPLEGLGYLSASLLALGFHLLETLLPVVPLVAAYLVWARTTPRGFGVLLAWALVPVLASFFYWHHGFHLGPRMLYESAPGWLLLAALAVVALAGNGRDMARPRPSRGRIPALRDVALWGVIASIPSMTYFAPRRASSYRWTPETVQRIMAPEPPGSRPAIVFVHGSWTERLAARLQAGGMGLDSLETALRRNDTCALHRWMAFRLRDDPAGDAPPQELDFRPLPGFPSHLAVSSITSGNRVLVDARAPWTAECRREAQADRTGIVSLAPLVWQGDLPGLEEGKPMFVRDLGPELNRRLLARYQDRLPFMLLTREAGGTPALVPYQQAEAMIWGDRDEADVSVP